jgi:hypothetical protein
MDEWVKGLIVFVIIVGCIVGIAQWMNSSWTDNCQKLGELSGYNTQYMKGYCWVELCDDTWVKRSDLIYYSDICD